MGMERWKSCVSWMSQSPWPQSQGGAWKSRTLVGMVPAEAP